MLYFNQEKFQSILLLFTWVTVEGGPKQEFHVTDVS